MPDPGPLLAIGGHEDRVGARVILRRVASHLGGRPLAVVTAASRHPEAYVERYTTAFDDLGVTVLEMPLEAEAAARTIGEAGGVYLTGGKQLRLVARLNELGAGDRIRRLWQDGGLVAGTSAGASALAGRMIVRGPGRRSPGVHDLTLGPALGLVEGVIIDQHFSERGRSGRLRAAVAAEPDCIGIGLDEDTAIEVVGRMLTVHGSGAVTVIDARGAATQPGARGRPATMREAALHILAAGDAFLLGAG